MARIEILKAQLEAAQEAARRHASAIASGEITVLSDGTEVSRYRAKDAPRDSEPKTLRIVTSGGTEYVPLRQLGTAQGRNAMAAHYRAVGAALIAAETASMISPAPILPPAPALDVNALLAALAALPAEERAALLAAAK